MRRVARALHPADPYAAAVERAIAGERECGCAERKIRFLFAVGGARVMFGLLRVSGVVSSSPRSASHSSSANAPG